MPTKNWNYERWRTRDRLIEYDFDIIAPYPHTAGLPIIYPWENLSLSQLEYQIITIAKNNGFSGTDETFWDKFSKNFLIRSTVDNFPVFGDECNLYLDINTNILYYFKVIAISELPDYTKENNIIISGYSEEKDHVYLYIPIQ